MDLNKVWPFTMDDHDTWLDIDPFTMVYIARHQMRDSSLSCLTSGIWTFLNIWTTRDKVVETMNKLGNGPDDYEIQVVPFAEICSIYRAITLDGVPKLLIGITSAMIMSSTYIPSNQLVTCPSTIWMYAVDKNNNDVVTKDGALIVSLTTHGLLVELNDHVPDFDDDYAKGLYEIKTIPLIGLVSKTKLVFTDRETYDVKKALALSKSHRRALTETENSNV